MASLSWEDFMDYVKAWIVEKQADIANMWPQKGGWEGWAQADLYAWILEKNNTYDILREQSVYTNGRKADFLLNNSSTGAKRVVCDLKCQSLENYKNFRKGLEDDIKKLIGDLKGEYNGSALLVIGIYFTNHGDIPNYFYKKVLGNGEVGICWAVDLNS